MKNNYSSMRISS